MERWLNDVEAAEHVGCSAALLRMWRQRGQGPRYAKVGRLVRYRLSDLQQFIEDRLVTPTAESR